MSKTANVQTTTLTVAKKSDEKAKVKTTFASVNELSEKFAQYFTFSDNEVHQYVRVSYLDKFKRDYYKIFKDFAIYYDRNNSYLISIADSTVIDCQLFKESHKQTEKTKELKFSVSADKLVDTLFEITAQRLTKANQFVEVSVKVKSATEKKRNSQRKAK